MGQTAIASDRETFPSKFDKLLTFSLSYRFIRFLDQYIYNNKVPQNTFLCEICENTSMLGKGLNNAFKSKDVPFDPTVLSINILLTRNRKSTC